MILSFLFRVSGQVRRGRAKSYSTVIKTNKTNQAERARKARRKKIKKLKKLKKMLS